MHRLRMALAPLASVLLVLSAACQSQSPTPSATEPATVSSPVAGVAPSASPLVSVSPSPALLPSPSPLASLVPSPTAVTLTRTSLQYGLDVFVWGHPDTTARDLKTATSAGFGWQKSLFQWRAMEPSRGVFDWRESDRVIAASHAAGLKVLARLDFQPTWARADGRTDNGAPDDPQDFADFISALVSRYSANSPNGELEAIEIWNEPNLQREWGHPINQQQAADYVKLLSAAYSAAHAANPGITVITAGLSPTGADDDTARPDDTYLGWLYQAGMAGHYDALGLHANAQAPDPLAAPLSLPDFRDASFYFRRVEQLRAVQEKAGEGSKPVWILEFGWTSDSVHPAYSWYAVTEQQKAANIVTAYRYALQNWQPWIGPMMLWTLPDPAWTPDREESWWAITDPDGTPRPALGAVQKARADGELP